MEKEKCYLESLDKEKCTGCGACIAVCPNHCIKFAEDIEGFKYPIIDKSCCVECHKCINTCPIINKVNNFNYLDNRPVLIYRTKNNLMEVSSGGAFEDLCKVFLAKREKIAIFGSSLDKDLKVCHKYINSFNEIHIFKKSKYVQSDIKDTYKEAKEFLSRDYYVVFSGTPCQIAGLKKFLNKDYSNLLCIDLICHGVPSQKVFNYYIESEERKHKDKIVTLNFREKVKLDNGKYTSKNIKIKYANNKELIEDSLSSNFLKGYSSRLFYRPSCYVCKFASPVRYSDLTIADAWGIEKININEDMHKGLSTIVANTVKGKKTIEGLTGTIIEKVDIQFIIDNNSAFAHPATYNKNRNLFFNNLNSENFDNKIRKYYKYSIFHRVRKKLSDIGRKFR